LEQDCEKEDILKVGVDKRLASFGTICPFIIEAYAKRML